MTITSSAGDQYEWTSDFHLAEQDYYYHSHYVFKITSISVCANEIHVLFSQEIYLNW